ncbi:ParA-like protein [hydrothermal vent metagenome]|uniref:ParA-like protein n=1 Tax=hydrothermal vent metagenome TaxID=652676 RepID=A0A3B1BB38_9ZZZZ
MRTIMLMNAKGGCGKTTLATNIATWFADEGHKVALADFDVQGSSLDWLEARRDYEGIPDIDGIDATKGPATPARGTDYLIMDVPAAIHGKAISSISRRAQTIIIPVLPSPIDIRACAKFIHQLLLTNQVVRHRTRVAVVANRVRENTIIYHQLEDFLGSLEIPFLTSLRESQNYIRAAERGLGIFELAPSSVFNDLVQWDPILEWLSSSDSMPQPLQK